MSQCYCMGPQNGQPACPCEMKNLKQVDGRWVKVIDFGLTKDHNFSENESGNFFNIEEFLNINYKE